MNPVARFLRKRWFIHLLLCIPVFYVFVPVLQKDTEYFADPAKYLLEYFGLASTYLFVAVSMITPLRKGLSKNRDFQKHRNSQAPNWSRRILLCPSAFPHLFSLYGFMERIREGLGQALHSIRNRGVRASALARCDQ